MFWDFKMKIIILFIILCFGCHCMSVYNCDDDGKNCHWELVCY